jgi:hypothetical protein
MDDNPEGIPPGFCHSNRAKIALAYFAKPEHSKEQP